MVTVLGVVFTDLLTGVALGMAVGIFMILYNNYKVPFHFDPRTHRPGDPIRIKLSEDVSFLNKASILRTLSMLPDGSHVIIDASDTVLLDDDVVEIIEEERARAASQDITLELIGFERVRSLSPLEGVEQAIKTAAARRREDMSWTGSERRP
jgi:MFS superfamily sulfate permease-like transporter